MTSAASAGNPAATYAYDGDGRRIKRIVNGTETWQVYGLGGELLAEYAANSAASSPQKEYGYRNGELLVTADVTTGLPAPVFSDDFNTASLDTTKWTATDSSRVTDNGQQLQISLLPNTAGYYEAYSNSTYDLTGKSAQVEIAQTVSQGGWAENMFEAALDDNNHFLIDVGAGSMILRSMVGGVNNQTVISYDSATMRYWRIRHDQNANTVSLETSGDGNTWTVRKTVTPGFSLTSLRFHMVAGAWGTGNGSPGAAKYDNFKLQSNTQTTIANLHWLVTDQIGTPRMIFDQSGSLANTSRHDYLPFGEELGAGVGGRTTAQGYSSNDGLRQKWTGKEQDNETGLDYFGARYYSNTQGRFTGVDPLMSSASLTSPQTWNRYSYTVNNPLRYTDPTGAYIFSDELGGGTSDADLLANAGDDKKKRKAAQNIIDQRNVFRNALRDAKAAGPKSDDPDRVAYATGAYGGDLINNGVVVGFGQNENNDPGVTGPNGTDLSFDNGTARAEVRVTIDKDASGENLISAVAHEGQHVADRQAYANAVNVGLAHGIPQDVIAASAWNMTVLTTETRAYRVSALVEQGRGQPNLEFGGHRIWDQGWKESERAEKMAKGIHDHLTSSDTYKNKLKNRIFGQ